MPPLGTLFLFLAGFLAGFVLFHNGSGTTERFRAGVKRMFASRSEVERLLKVSPPDPTFSREVDAAADQEP